MKTRIAVALLTLALGASPVLAGRVATKSVFETERGTRGIETRLAGEALRMGGTRLASPEVSITELNMRRNPAVPSGGSTRRRVAISVLASAVLPGLGELYLYLDSRDPWTLARVPLFMAFDAYNWYMYRDNHDTGKDIKREYMAFADAHWSEARFLEQHPCCVGYGGCESWEWYNEWCSDQGSDYFLYMPKSQDVEEYYENLGKYDPFVYGWDDWATWSVEQPGNFWTPNRTRYVSLRQESNKYLGRADDNIMYLIVNRVVSMVDAGWIAYRMGSGGPVERAGWDLDLDPGPEKTAVSLVYRF
ncbi:MAG: hypothetical protein JW876_12175 [Candidatus Krumholzibacteriota bacterium]|nr:hypothetical protein [Candidatus Krumholzibacteriota bacterium]